MTPGTNTPSTTQTTARKKTRGGRKRRKSSTAKTNTAQDSAASAPVSDTTAPPPDELIAARASSPPTRESEASAESESEPTAERATSSSSSRKKKSSSRAGGKARKQRKRRQSRTSTNTEASATDESESPQSSAPVVASQEKDREVTTTRQRTSRRARREETEFASVDPPGPGSQGREMLINVSVGDECRIAVLDRGRLEELFIERTASQSHVGNIYKGRITNIEPSIQAAFVDFGLPQNGFLHISDVQPQYFPNHKGGSEEVGKKIPRHSRPPIQKCFRRGQEVIVQVTKEGVGTKGPTLTTYLSIPGRFLVMMPGMNRHGVSRKIEDEEARKKMRQVIRDLDLPSGMGFIVRTAGVDRTKRELQRDLHYLTRLWKAVVERIKSQPSPAALYQESDLVTRTLRDVYGTDYTRIVVDDEETARKVREFLRIVMPKTKVNIQLYRDPQPLFHRFGIEAEIEKIHLRHVPLASGGSIVIDQTEAMVTIDVNSGRFRPGTDAEEAAYKINIEAAEEIARQLRLRDLGGLIVCDFIDMRLDKHRRGVERTLRDALKKHKERARILRMSAFGLIEMTRQRRGPALERNIFDDCPYCGGTGQMKTVDSVTLDAMRIIRLAAYHPDVRTVSVTVSPEVAYRLLNEKRTALHKLETDTGKTLLVRGDAGFTTDQVAYRCEDARGREVDVVPDYSKPAETGRKS
ncbi:MAG: Rne/Rng family ribonuclease [Planctomycetota bacterium]|nr:MAG: Rne/Rng family ribonuclease [Planctomycetota bacterium]